MVTIRVLNPQNYRSAEGGIVTRANVDRLLDAGMLSVRMQSGKFWKIRRNGVTKLWKKDGERIRIPYKFGFKGCGFLDEHDFVEMTST